ncbi:hypothetical protein NE237_032632 [Protea cynaroides]|uniref:Transmembrane protein n=1 Tax=Protea cynaroides TaxID=273540 RepID=A0A9Q0R3R1_9MAGN|nr:hypothetical protein NE237_032632 [Protea cynaroides]
MLDALLALASERAKEKSPSPTKSVWRSGMTLGTVVFLFLEAIVLRKSEFQSQNEKCREDKNEGRSTVEYFVCFIFIFTSSFSLVLAVRGFQSAREITGLHPRLRTLCFIPGGEKNVERVAEEKGDRARGDFVSGERRKLRKRVAKEKGDRERRKLRERAAEERGVKALLKEVVEGSRGAAELESLLP